MTKTNSTDETNRRSSLGCQYSSASLLRFVRLFSLFFLVCMCLNRFQIVQAENNVGCLLDENVCESYEYCYEDLGAGGICLNSDDMRVASLAKEEAKLETAIRSINEDVGYEDNSEEDDDDEASTNRSDFEVTNDEDDDERGPILQSLRSEEATPLYLADAPIRVHKYNYQRQIINDEDQKIDDFVKYIENVNGSDDDDDDEDDDEDADKNENAAQEDYKTRVLRLFLNQIGISSNRINDEDSDNSINQEYLEALTRGDGGLTDDQYELPNYNGYEDDDDADEGDDNDDDDDEQYIPLIGPKRSIDPSNKFVLLTNENGVAPVQSFLDQNDLNEDASEDIDDAVSSEEKILERIHHDLEENFLIEKLVDALQEEKQSSSDPNKLEKRFSDPILTKVDRHLSQIKYQTDINDDIQDQENMIEGALGYANIQDELIDDSYIFIETDRILSDDNIKRLIEYISSQSSIPLSSFKNITQRRNLLMFKLENADRLIDDSNKTMQKIAENGQKLLLDKGIIINAYGIGRETKWRINRSRWSQHPFNIDPNSERFVLITLVACLTLTGLLVMLTVVYMCKRRSQMNTSLLKNVGSGTTGTGGPVYRINFSDDESLIHDNKRSSGANVFVRGWQRVVEAVKCAVLRRNPPSYTAAATKSSQSTVSTAGPLTAPTTGDGKDTTADYQELCRQRAKCGGTGNKGNVSPTIVNEKTDSPRSSTSSWSDEPIKSHNIDITTGHSILSYMEEHLNDKNRLQEEWSNLCEYEPEPNKCEIGSLPENMTKNRYSNILPFDHSRVKLKNRENDYINANYIVDDDPRNPSYIAAQGPLMHTTNDFWHMVWEEESVVIVSLCRTIEYGSAKCHQFWPGNGSCVYDKFEIHLVSEHVWCEDYLVRNFFLKNLEQNQTRTVTQFHFLTWPENGVPQNVKSFLDFRRRVNKSFKAKSSPLVIHCNDGVGRTGTYLLIDMVLNKISKGAKEIDIAATLEFLRDQRPGMIKNKAQFEYSFAVITEELHNMLKALRQ